MHHQSIITAKPSQSYGASATIWTHTVYILGSLPPAPDTSEHALL